jgi:hypothetical protein
MAVVALAHPSPAACASVLSLQQRSQMTFGYLAASHQQIEQSRRLIRAADAAQARTHAIGVRYADWRLRLDITMELRRLTAPLG